MLVRIPFVKGLLRPGRAGQRSIFCSVLLRTVHADFPLGRGGVGTSEILARAVTHGHLYAPRAGSWITDRPKLVAALLISSVTADTGDEQSRSDGAGFRPALVEPTQPRVKSALEAPDAE